MAFTLPDLPYSHDALAAGGMSRETLEFHHDKHHKAYVDKLNELVQGTEWENASLEDIVRGTYQDGAVAQNGIFNNASQHWNHSQFWEMMSPNGGGTIPSQLESAIKDSFGSVEEFKKKFSEAGVGQFGSGWVWLIVDGQGELQVTSTPNQDNPLMGDAATPGTPILGNDVWEHAYYLTYNNRRPDHLKA